MRNLLLNKQAGLSLAELIVAVFLGGIALPGNQRNLSAEVGVWF